MTLVKTDAEWTHWISVHHKGKLLSLEESADYMGGNPTFNFYADAEAFVEDPLNIEIFGRMSVMERNDEYNPGHQGCRWVLYCNQPEEYGED